MRRKHYPLALPAILLSAILLAVVGLTWWARPTERQVVQPPAILQTSSGWINMDVDQLYILVDTAFSGDIYLENGKSDPVGPQGADLYWCLPEFIENCTSVAEVFPGVPENLVYAAAFFVESEGWYIIPIFYSDYQGGDMFAVEIIMRPGTRPIAVKWVPWYEPPPKNTLDA